MSEHTGTDHSTAPTSRRALRRGALPGRVRTSTGLPWAHTAVFTFVVPLLSVPVLLVSMSAGWLCSSRWR